MKRFYLLFSSLIITIFSLQSYVISDKTRKKIARQYFPQALNLLKEPGLCVCWKENDFARAIVILFGERFNPNNSIRDGIVFESGKDNDTVFISTDNIMKFLEIWQLYKYDEFWKFLNNLFPDSKIWIERIHSRLHSALKSNYISESICQRICYEASKMRLEFESFRSLEDLQKEDALHEINNKLDKEAQSIRNSFQASWKEQFIKLDDDKEWDTAINYIVEVIEKNNLDVAAYVVLDYLFHRVAHQEYLYDCIGIKEDFSYKDLKKHYKNQADQLLRCDPYEPCHFSEDLKSLKPLFMNHNDICFSFFKRMEMHTIEAL